MNILDHIDQFPHCDQRVLHAPEDGCKYCNAHGDWQALRIAWGIAFTGHSYDKVGKPTTDERGATLQPCPAEADRGMESINSWGGNVAMTPEAEKIFDEEMEKVKAAVAKYAPHESPFVYPIDPTPTFGGKATLSG